MIEKMSLDTRSPRNTGVMGRWPSQQAPQPMPQPSGLNGLRSHPVAPTPQLPRRIKQTKCGPSFRP